MPSQYRQNAAWIVSDGAARNLRGLVDSNGQPILADGNGSGEQQTLPGAPVHISPDMPAPATGARSVLFGDFSRAHIIRRMRVRASAAGRVVFVKRSGRVPWGSSGSTGVSP